MARHVELGHHVHAALPRVAHHLLDVPMRVALLRGEGALPHLRHRRHLDRERLVVHQMPMQHVQLDPRHRVDDALDRGNGEVVARRVDHQRAVLAMMPRRDGYVEEGGVLNLDGRVLDYVRGGVVVELDEEHQRVQRVVRAVDVLGGDLDGRAVRGHGEAVALVLRGLLLRGRCKRDLEHHFLVLDHDVHLSNRLLGGLGKAAGEDGLLEARGRKNKVSLPLDGLRHFRALEVHVKTEVRGIHGHHLVSALVLHGHGPQQHVGLFACGNDDYRLRGSPKPPLEEMR